MNFKYKCYLQRLFSALPQGEKLNFLFQTHLTRSLPVSDEIFLRKVHQGIQHHQNFLEFNQVNGIENRYYEFGAGWDLIIPLTVCQLGMEAHVVDIKKLVVNKLVNHSLQQLYTHRHSFPFEVSPPKVIANLSDLTNHWGLHYQAPLDARNTPFPNNFFHFSSSTSTLEHIPPEDILAILTETYRILKPGGIVSLIIDYQDHWSYFDANISVYNFLTYSPSQWKRYNPSLQYQNRLRHSDYLQIISQTPFQIVKETPFFPSEIQEEALKNLPLAKDYQEYGFEELKILGGEWVLRK